MFHRNIELTSYNWMEQLACSKIPSECVQTILGFSTVSLETGNECKAPTLMRYFSNNLISRLLTLLDGQNWQKGIE